MDFAGTGGMMRCIEVHYDRKSETRVPSHVYIHAQVVVVLVVLRTTTLARAQHFSTPPARRGALARGGRGLSPWEKGRGSGGGKAADNLLAAGNSWDRNTFLRDRKAASLSAHGDCTGAS